VEKGQSPEKNWIFYGFFKKKLEFAENYRILYVKTLSLHYQYNKGRKMAKNTTIQARIDGNTKTKAQRILGALNISMSEAISFYLRQIIFHKGIPFELKIPNELTAKTLEKAEKGEELHEAASVEELFKELES